MEILIPVILGLVVLVLFAVLVVAIKGLLTGAKPRKRVRRDSNGSTGSDSSWIAVGGYETSSETSNQFESESSLGEGFDGGGDAGGGGSGGDFSGGGDSGGDSGGGDGGGGNGGGGD